MPLIERYTPGGNFYPDGASTFVVLVDLFRNMAENRDVRDTLQKQAWEAGDAATLSAAQATVDGVEAQANAYTDSATETTLAAASAEAAAKADAAEANAMAHADTAATNAKNDSKAYTDATFAASAPGGATDAQVDAAVDRAVLGGRIMSATRVDAGVIEITFS